MKEITVELNGLDGDPQATFKVCFEGEKLGEHERYVADPLAFGLLDENGPGMLCRTRVLYRAADGRLVVHQLIEPCGGQETYSRAKSRLFTVTEADLQHGGGLQALGAVCGFARSLTLEEALGYPAGDGDKETETPKVERFSTAFNEVIAQEREDARRAALQKVKEQITEARDIARGMFYLEIEQMPEEDGATRKRFREFGNIMNDTLEAILQALEKEL